MQCVYIQLLLGKEAIQGGDMKWGKFKF